MVILLKKGAVSTGLLQMTKMCQKASQQGRISGETDRSPSPWQTAGISHRCNVTPENLWYLRDCVGLVMLCTCGHWLPVCVRKDRSPVAVWCPVTLRSISQGNTSCLMTSVGVIWEPVPIRAAVAAENAFILLLFSPPDKPVSAWWLLKEMPVVTETFWWLLSTHSLKSKLENRKRELKSRAIHSYITELEWERQMLGDIPLGSTRLFAEFSDISDSLSQIRVG